MPVPRIIVILIVRVDFFLNFKIQVNLTHAKKS